MDCEKCADDVKKQLAYTKGVKFVETDFEKDIVVVKYRNDRTDADKIIASLGEIKYVASVYSPGCGSAKRGCCSGKTTTSTSGCGSKTTDAQHSGCASKTTDAQHSGCAGKTATTGEAKTGCCSGKTTEPAKK
jgi:copper chaperone CopZ